MRKKTNEKFLKEVYSLVCNEYTFLEKYKTCHEKIKVIHNKCNHIYYVTPNNFLKENRRCPNCYGNKKYTREEIEQKIFEKVKDDYKLIKIYKKRKRLMLFLLHRKCNKYYKVSFIDFIYKIYRCPICNYKNRSKGESIIENWLKKYGIKYKKQYGFNDCIYKRKLKFDFMIYNTDGNIFCLIEFDGEQHFHKDKIYWRKKNRNPKEAFNLIKERDKIKNDYCKKNKIPLFRISYKNIENIHYILAEEIFGEFKKELGIKKKYKKVK